jgi:FKBP12-rapamycin complex-associated protein
MLQKVQEEWYESLNNWDEALALYQNKSYLRPDDSSLTLGKMRCLRSMGEWYVCMQSKMYSDPQDRTGE